MFTFERCSLFMIYHKYCVTEWEEFGTEKKCSYFGVVHFLEVFTFGGFTVLNQGWLRIYTKYNIIKFTAIISERTVYSISLSFTITSI